MTFPVIPESFPIIPWKDDKLHFKSILSRSDIIPTNDEKWHCMSSLNHSYLQLSRKGYNIFELFLLIFLAIKNTFSWQIVPKIQHFICVSTFHSPINAPNGTLSQPERTAGARRSDTIEHYWVVASLNALKFNPLTFFSLGPCFRDI